MSASKQATINDEVIYLRDGGLSFPEIGKRLGMSYKAARYHYITAKSISRDTSWCRKLPNRIQNVLNNANITNMEQLIEAVKNGSILRMRNYGCFSHECVLAFIKGEPIPFDYHLSKKKFNNLKR